MSRKESTSGTGDIWPREETTLKRHDICLKIL